MTADFTLSEGEASKRPAVAGSIKTTAQELITDLTEILIHDSYLKGTKKQKAVGQALI